MPRLNEGHRDRGFRLALGVLFGSFALTTPGAGTASGIATVLAVVLFATAAVGFCPLYALLGVSTAPTGAEG